MPSDPLIPEEERASPFGRLRTRIVAVLIGMMVILTGGALAYDSWSRGHQGDLLGAQRLGGAIARAVTDADAALLGGRSVVAALAPLGDETLTARWQPGPDPGVPKDWTSTRLPSLSATVVAVEGGPLVHALPEFSGGPEARFADLAAFLARELRPALLFVPLADGSWLEFSSPRYWRARITPVKVGLIVLLSLVVLAVLAVRAAAWLAAPLERLAEAVARADDPLHPSPLPRGGPVEVAALADAVTRSRTGLGEILEGRTRLLATISHDLRTPITHLRLRADLIDDDALRGKFLKDIEDMQAMIAAILDFLVDDVMRESEEVVSFASLLQSLCDDYADTGQPVGFTAPPPLEFETVRTVFGGPAERVSFGQHRQILLRARPRSLRRALANLIDNALKYGERADVTLSADTHWVVVDIVDDGPGIPDDKQAEVMKPFVRLHTDEGGSGLGLSIVKSVVEAHGGRIELSNRLRGGLRARVSLPRQM